MWGRPTWLGGPSAPSTTLPPAGHPDLGERVGQDGIAARELMAHRIEGYARHRGHADLLRERIDKRVGR